MKKIAFVLIILISSTNLAQDGYYGRPSNYPPNVFEVNTSYNFDYKMTGIMERGSNRFPLTLYVNSADGSIGVKGEDVEFMLASPIESSLGKFDFAVLFPEKGYRMYGVLGVDDEGEQKVSFASNRSLSAPAAQLELVQSEKFHRFMQNATKTNAGNHPEFGSQKLYTGEINGKEFKITISNGSAPVKITPAHVGYLCGVFADDNQRKNRYITKFVTPDGVTVEMHTFTPTNYIWTASGYSEIGQSNFNVESMVDNEDTLAEISQRIARITREMDYSNPDAIQMSTLKMRIETQRFNAIKSGHPERQISEEAAGALINLKAQIIDKSKQCKRYAEMGFDEEEALCREQLRRLEDRFNEMRNRYLPFGG